MTRIVECGSCGGYHRTEYHGDCRNNSERFASEDDAMEQLGLASVEVERCEFDNDGEMTERFVETYPECDFVEALPTYA